IAPAPAPLPVTSGWPGAPSRRPEPPYRLCPLLRKPRPIASRRRDRSISPLQIFPDPGSTNHRLAKAAPVGFLLHPCPENRLKRKLPFPRQRGPHPIGPSCSLPFQGGIESHHFQATWRHFALIAPPPPGICLDDTIPNQGYLERSVRPEPARAPYGQVPPLDQDC